MVEIRFYRAVLLVPMGMFNIHEISLTVFRLVSLQDFVFEAHFSSFNSSISKKSIGQRVIVRLDLVRMM